MLFFLTNYEFISAPENIAFSVSLLVLAMIAMMEGVGCLIGVSLGSLLDKLFPQIDLDLDLPAEVSSDPGFMLRVCGWLRIGQVPLLVILIVFCLVFGLFGLFLQSVCYSIFHRMLPWWMASILTFLSTLPVMRVSMNLLSKVLPRDETDAVPLDSLVGRVGVITIGKAFTNHPAQLRVKDMKGTSHYVMVEPDRVDVEFEAKEQILLVKQHKPGVFYGIRNPHRNLFS